MKKIIFCLIMVILNFTYQSKAQCASSGSVTTTITTTPNICAGNGTITASFNTVTNITIQLIKGGTILQSVANPTSPYTFTNLQPGTDYEVKTICSVDNSIVYSTNSNISVADNYVPISNADISVTDVCTNFTSGGTITISGVTGGTAPYQYSVIKNGDAGYEDSLSSYSTSSTKNVTEFGTYQIRIKDACGGFSTFTKTIQPNVNPIRFYWFSKEICGSNQVQGSVWYVVDNITGATSDGSELFPSGVKLKIQADNASGAVLFDGIYSGTPFTYTPSASHVYYVTTTNACGATVSYTYSLTNPVNNPEFLNFVPNAFNSGCGVAETETLSIDFGEQYYWSFPLTIVVKNSAGVIIHTTPSFNGVIWSLPGLPLDTYTITVSDSCLPANSVTKIVDSPVLAGSPVLSLQSTPNWRCAGGEMVLNQTGTIQALISISGYMPDASNAVVTIIAGPSNVGVDAVLIDGQYWGWTNLLPGTYTVSYTSCGVSHTGTFTINNSGVLLQQSLTSTAVSTCNSGGSITSNRIYNGAYPFTVELLNSAGTVIDSNATGNFSNLPPGTYTTRLFIQPCNIPSAYYYIAGSTVVISNSTTGVSINSALGVICEDAAGNPLSTGSAYIDLSGVAPYTVTYRVQGSGSAYTTINTSNSSIQIDNLTANTVYELNLSDSCGSNSVSSVQIKTMGNISSSNTQQPCAGSPYVLTMPYYSGAAYEWVNPQGVVVSNTRIYSIANYNSSYDGTYVCKITWSNCVTRFVNVTTNSALCEQGCLPDPYAAQMSWWMGGVSNPKTRVRIDFVGNPPVATLNNPALGVFGHGESGLGFEGHAGATNPNSGEFLFATDGNTVYRASDGVKATGGGIGGHNSAAESAAIIPDPQGILGKDFIVFGNTAFNTDIGQLNAGKYNLETNEVLGITTLLNNTSDQGIAEALEVVPKSNGKDYWILVYSVQSYLRVYEYTAAGGFNPTYISQVSVPSPIDSGNYQHAYISWIPQHENKILVGRQSKIGLVDFNRTTGVISNYQVKITSTNSGEKRRPGYSSALSPNGRYIYYSDRNTSEGKAYLKYLDLQTDAITIIGVATFLNSDGGVKVGPDGRLYWSDNFALRYINDADNPPTGLGDLQTFDTDGREISIQLPNNTYWACSTCQAGDDAPILNMPIPTNPPASTIGDLIDLLSASNQPAGTEITIHSGTPATDANKLANSTTIVSGTTYYVSFFDGLTICYSPTTSITIENGVCYADPSTATGIPVNHGITLLKRAGTDNGNWPMIRNSAHTVLESNTKGFVITRVSTAGLASITNPQEGMMVYDTTAKCLKIYADGVWSCFTVPACP